MNIIKQSITMAIFLLIALNCAAQDSFYFKKWKSKQVFEEKLVVFQIDTSGTEKEIRPYLLAIDRTISNLDTLGFSYDIIPFPNDSIIRQGVLMLRFEKLSNAYVKINSGPKTPACYRIKVTQPNSTAKKKIETIISISIPDFKMGLEQFGEAFTQKLLKHFSREE